MTGPYSTWTEPRSELPEICSPMVAETRSWVPSPLMSPMAICSPKRSPGSGVPGTLAVDWSIHTVESAVRPLAEPNITLMEPALGSPPAKSSG